MSVSMTTTEARAALHDLLDRVERGGEVTITRHGRPIAVVVRPDALRVRRADHALAAASELRDRLEAGRATPLSATRSMAADRADELVAEVRSGRRAR